MRPPDPRPELRHLKAVQHGAVVPRDLKAAGHDPAGVLDFSTNINPFGPSPAVKKALAELDPAPYPDRHADAISEAIAEQYSVTRQYVLVGSGASELIWLIALAYADRDRRVAVLSPTYGEYAHACRVMGAAVVEIWADEANGYAFDTALANSLANSRPDIVFVCNPNNPTGRLLDAESLLRLRAAAPDALWVIDEAYRSFVRTPPALENWLDEAAGTRVLLLRSLTKEHALAGLRLGYLLGSPETLTPLSVAQPPWSVSTAAQVAGLAALQDAEHLKHTIAATRSLGAKLCADLRALGLEVLPTDTHYALVNVGDSLAFARSLLERHILVRSGASFGLPAYIRIAPRPAVDNERLLEAIASLPE